MLKHVMVALALFTATNIASAKEQYKVYVTHKGSNLYKIDGQRAWVQTRYCYEYGYSEDAILSSFSIVFLSSGTECDVRRVLTEAEINPGKYIVTVTRETDDLYSTTEGIWLKTSTCLSLALSQEAILELYPNGTGVLKIRGDLSTCTVDATLKLAKF